MVNRTATLLVIALVAENSTDSLTTMRENRVYSPPWWAVNSHRGNGPQATLKKDLRRNNEGEARSIEKMSSPSTSECRESTRADLCHECVPQAIKTANMGGA